MKPINTANKCMQNCFCEILEHTRNYSVQTTSTSSFLSVISMVGHLFQNYDTIYVRFLPTYTCNHSCYTVYVRFLSRILAFYSQVYDHFLTNAHIYAHKKAHICLQTSMWYMRSEKVVV